MHTDFPLRKIIVQFCDHIIFIGTTGKFSNERIWSEWLMLRVNGQRLALHQASFECQCIFLLVQFVNQE